MTIPASPGDVRPPTAPPASRQPAPKPRTPRRRKLVVGAAAALVLGALAIARYASAPVDESAAADPQDRLDRAADVAESQPVADKPALEAVPVASAGVVPAPVVTEQPATPVVKPRPTKTVTARPAKPRVAASARSTAPVAPPAVSSAPARESATVTNERAPFVSAPIVAGPPPVTVIGCLEMSVNRDEFRLSDTDGVDVPKSRSWRTAFLTKRATPVALVEPPDPRGLQVQVGKRVSATGVLTDREMKVSAIRVVAPSCN
jgi:hypothetical protein